MEKKKINILICDSHLKKDSTKYILIVKELVCLYTLKRGASHIRIPCETYNGVTVTEM